MCTIPPRQAALTTLLAAVALAVGVAAAEQATSGVPAAADHPARSCLRCGATCDLEPICVCSPGTTRRPTVEYDVDCEPICLAGCGSSPWPSGRRQAAGCSSCVESPCNCPGRVRHRKILRKETHDDEVCVVERRVAYLCGRCAGRGAAGCCEPGPSARRPTWWETLTSWWQ